MVGVLCGCRATDGGSNRPGGSGGEGTATVSMSRSNDGSESLVAALSMFVFVGVSNGILCIVVGGVFFWSRALFPSAPRHPQPCIN